ncbi:MAG: oxidoreductase [Planctomycetes bacterium]|nr:oxidoreductase [Planctomycetota bacterium]
MFTEASLLWIGRAVIVAPMALLAMLGLPSLIGKSLSERAIHRCVQIAVSLGLLASVAMLDGMLLLGTEHVVIDFGDWVSIPHFHFHVNFVFDRLSVPFVIMCFLLCGIVGAFANRYMHRERGFSRFFVFYALFLLGCVMTTLANTIETLFTGWELVGLSSALLVAFFHERLLPVRNGLRVWAIYRVSDAALLVASVVLHHTAAQGDFDGLFGTGVWPEGQSVLDPSQAFWVGLLVLIAAAGKSALVPFSGWLPRAMEGPTPSSAVFYGALSVHLGAYLLLRVSPILQQSPLLCVLVVAVGLITAVFASFTGRVQTDIKCALVFASLTQVGIIVAEIGLGWHYLALIHIIGHACLRTLQFIRAPTLLHDYRTLENAIGGRLGQTSRLKLSWWERLVGERTRRWFYRLALERGYLDVWLNIGVVDRVLSAFAWCDRLERRWTDFLSGGTPTEPIHVEHPSSTIDELLAE